MNKFDLLLSSNKKIAIWGLGFYGMNCLDFLINSAKLSISLIIDQNKHETMSEYSEVPLVSPDSFINDSTNKNYIVIVTIRNGVKFNSNFLKSQGIEVYYFDQIYLQSNCEEAKEIYEILEDDKSKLIYSTLIGNRMILSEKVPVELIQADQYFCLPDFTRQKNQFFIDCGAYVGDTFEKWLEINEGNISAYLGIDPVALHAKKFSARYKRLCNEYNLSKSEVEFITRFIASKKGILNTGGSYGSSTSQLSIQSDLKNFISDQSLDETVECTTIDLEVQRMLPKLTNIESIFLKMDIEGGEFDALQGALETLKKYRPLLAISIYHRIDDYIRIPCFLKNNLEGYRFFIRHHSRLADETVLYCSPK